MCGSLTDADWLELERCLAKTHAIGSTEMLDGFLTALICGPEFMPAVLEGHRFDSDADAQTFTDLVLRYWHRVAGALKHAADAGERYTPLMAALAGVGVLGEQWVEGFMRGTHYRAERWDQFIAGRMGLLMAPVLYLYADTSPNADIRREVPQELLDERAMLLDALSRHVVGMYLYFTRQRRNTGRTTRAGQHDLCPCESGKAYKDCCLLAASAGLLH